MSSPVQEPQKKTQVQTQIPHEVREVVLAILRRVQGEKGKAA